MACLDRKLFNLLKTPQNFYRTGNNGSALWNYDFAPFPKLIYLFSVNVNSNVVAVKTYVSIFKMRNVLNSEETSR